MKRIYRLRGVQRIWREQRIEENVGRPCSWKPSCITGLGSYPGVVIFYYVLLHSISVGVYFICGFTFSLSLSDVPWCVISFCYSS